MSPHAPVRAAAGQLEIHVAIEPTEVELTRLRYLAASLEVYGGALGQSPLIVTVGGDEEATELVQRGDWVDRDVEWRWVDPELFARYGLHATKLVRLTYEIGARFAIFLDADVLVVGPFTDLLEEVSIAAAVAGAPAREPHRQLEEIAYQAGIEGPSEGRLPSIDASVLVAPQRHVRELADIVFPELDRTLAAGADDPVSLAISLAIARRQIPWFEFARRFAFALGTGALWGHFSDRLDLRILRYGGASGVIDPVVDFASTDAVAELLTREALWEEEDEAFLLRLERVHRSFAELSGSPRSRATASPLE